MLASVILTQRVYTDSAGAFYELPVLHTEAGYFIPLIDYCLANAAKSNSWMRKIVRYVQFFLEYMHANPHEHNSHLLFQNFVSRLETGTFNTETGHGRSRLGWTPRSPKQVQEIVTYLSDFFDWLSRDNPATAFITQRLPLSVYGNAASNAANTYRRKYSLLGHLWKTPEGYEELRRRAPPPEAYAAQPPAFPDGRFEELLDRGFKVDNRPHFVQRI